MAKAKKLDVNEKVDERRAAEVARREGPKQDSLLKSTRNKGDVVNSQVILEQK